MKKQPFTRIPDSFDPPKGWTFMARTLEEVHIGGEVESSELAMSFVAMAFQQVRSKSDVVRAYVYPQMVLVMVWSAANSIWIGTAVSRTPKVLQ